MIWIFDGTWFCMRFRDGAFDVAATDLSNHIACAHLTTLEMAKARGQLKEGYSNFDPLLKILQERGREHEKAYAEYLRRAGKRVEAGGNNTLGLMEAGVDVITQADLSRGAWRGRPDFLVRCDRPTKHWPWSYEVIDTKLSAETRAAAVLQLCVYSDLLSTLQGLPPLAMHVVKPGPEFPKDSFRFAEYAAIYRAFRGDLEGRLATDAETYPEPVANCDTCNWRDRCDNQRRKDDHLTFVADLGRSHRRELDRCSISTMAGLAHAPTPWPHKPERGSRETYDKLVQQARLQIASRGAAIPQVELLAVEPERGLSRLPAPNPGDVFLDFEGDPFIGEHGREYLFGWYTQDDGYKALWALDDTSERAALQEFMAFVMARWKRHSDMHVYHFAPYEPSALKRLTGRYAVCLDELDLLLRGRRLIDLHSITRQAARIGVETYSIKSLESLVGYTRPKPLNETGPAVHAVKLALQRDLATTIEGSWRTDVEAYNRGDCESALFLRNWLEAQRDALIAAGRTIERPPLLDGQPEKVNEDHTLAAATAARLLDGISPERSKRDDAQQARWLLGHLMKWYRREDKVTWWELFRLAETSDEERLDEPKAISGLAHLQRLPRAKGQRVEIDRYTFPAQEVAIGTDDGLRTHDGDDGQIGTLEAIDMTARTVDIRKTGKTADFHPASVFAHKFIGPQEKQSTLVRIGVDVADHGFASANTPSLARDLLFRFPPRGLAAAGESLRGADEEVAACAVRLARSLSGTVLPIQGPPGTGKSTTAAAMIVALVQQGRRVGVTATSHAVIDELLRKVVTTAAAQGQRLRAVIKDKVEDAKKDPRIEYTESAKDADALARSVDVLGATAWQWARATMRGAVDVLFIDEAGQMCLADAVAVCESANSIVLVGDPQQLEQPIQGTHPDGVAVSVLQHMLGDSQTIAADRGLLLDQTHRLHPTICAFTSEQFYEGRLLPGPHTDAQGIAAAPFAMPGLFWLPVEHRGNQNRSPEEADAVATLLAKCLVPEAFWTNDRGKRCPLTQNDVLVVGPYNAHVAAVRAALVARGLPDVRVGTVDKFQGKEAAIAVYTMATSVPEDAPRGLSFLYDRHRLNVATSRARSAAVLVCTPALTRPPCSTPEHLHLASALASFVERALRLKP